MTQVIIKTPEQIEGIRKSCQLAAKTLNFLRDEVKPGISTESLNQLADKFIRDHGAIPAPLNYNGFPKSICTSINEVICHGIPSEFQVLKEGDIINIDVTTILDGYYGDTSYTYAVGNISNKANNLIEVAKKCLDIGIQQALPGRRIGNIGFEIYTYANLQGYSVVYEFCGHGVGLQFHEEPSVPHVAYRNSGIMMKPGMVFTIEPMINEGYPEAVISETDGWTASTPDGCLSAQFEHTILITSSGHEILTS